MESHKRLLLANKAWAKEKAETKPGFFQHLQRDQTPEFLWIGCSDSRVPAEEITGVQPGEIFVHRNVANVILHSDLNLQSVLQYAVETLAVKHIIVCGHYNCGGIRAALSKENFGLLNKWLFTIKDNYSHHEAELLLLSPEDQLKRMVELNVLQQVTNLSRMAIIQRAWGKLKLPSIHGWIFGLHDGIIRELVSMNYNSSIDPIFRFKNL